MRIVSASARPLLPGLLSHGVAEPPIMSNGSNTNSAVVRFSEANERASSKESKDRTDTVRLP